MEGLERALSLGQGVQTVAPSCPDTATQAGLEGCDAKFIAAKQKVLQPLVLILPQPLSFSED